MDTRSRFFRVVLAALLSLSLWLVSPTRVVAEETVAIASGEETAGTDETDAPIPGFAPITPTRVLDTRPSGRVEAGGTVAISLPSKIVEQDRVTAVAMTLTVVNPDGWGFATVYPCDAPRPDASTMNYNGQDRAASVFSRLSASGEVCVYTYASANILVDVSGAFYDTSTYTSITPHRATDTRQTGRLEAGSTVVTQVTGVKGIPETATHVVATVAAIGTDGWGFLTTYACDQTRPDASTVNYNAGWDVANQAIIPLSALGQACTYTYAGTDVLFDVVGYFEGMDDLASPTRVADSRAGNADRYASVTISPRKWNDENSWRNTYDYRIVMIDARQAGTRVSSIYANIGVLPRFGTSGFVAPIPCGAARDSDVGTSVVNYSGGDIANAAVLDVNRAGFTCLLVRDYSYAAEYVDVIVDVVGWTPYGWDTDGDGIEDSDETENCRTTADCDGDGTNDTNEDVACELYRGCAEYDSDETDREPNDIDHPNNDDGDSGDSDDGSGNDDADSGDSDDGSDNDDADSGDSDDGSGSDDSGDSDDGSGNDDEDDGDSDDTCADYWDCDADGLWNYEDPDDNNPDIDGDGVLDGDEAQDWDADPGDFYRCVQDVDCDDDGVLDGDEQETRCALEVDCDSDGLDDLDEEPGCAASSDCDWDGVSDPEEETGCVTLSDCDSDGLSDDNDPDDKDTDTDGDGILDGDEPTDYWADDRYRCVQDVDCDDDSVLDGDEETGCTLQADCDSDGVDDGDEETGCVKSHDCDDDGLWDRRDPNDKNTDTDGDGLRDGDDAAPSVSTISLGGGIVAHDMKTVRADDFANTWTYGLYYCDATAVADSFDRWGSKLTINGADITPENVRALLQEGFDELSGTLVEGRVTVNVVLRNTELADPTTGECSFPGAWEAPYSLGEGAIQVATHRNTNSYMGRGAYGTGPSWIDMNTGGSSDTIWFKGVLAHEFGHNLRWKHANYSTENSTNWKYDSTFDLMGIAWKNVTTFDRLLQIGAISANQIIGHNSGTTNATLEAHAYYRGSVAPSNSKRGILVAPTGTPYTRNGSNVLLGIEPAKTSSHRGVILNFIEIGEYVNGNYLADTSMTASHPLAADEWTDSFVGVGETKTFFGVTVTVHSQDSDGTTNVTVTGSLTSGQWAAAVQSLFAATANSHNEHCGVAPSSVPFNPAPATQIEHVASGYELRSRTALMERIQQDGSQTGDPPSIDGPDGDSSLQPGLEPEHGYGCGCCC